MKIITTIVLLLAAGLAHAESDVEKIVRIEKENAALRVEVVKLRAANAILRQQEAEAKAVKPAKPVEKAAEEKQPPMPVEKLARVRRSRGSAKPTERRSSRRSTPTAGR